MLKKTILRTTILLFSLFSFLMSFSVQADPLSNRGERVYKPDAYHQWAQNEGENPSTESNRESTSGGFYFSEKKFHQYLGLGSLVLAFATIPTAPDDDDEEDGLHSQLAKGALALGAAAITTGLVYHWDKIGFDVGITDLDNVHMTLGIAGTLGYLMAIQMAPEDEHSYAGEIGAVIMALAIVIEW